MKEYQMDLKNMVMDKTSDMLQTASQEVVDFEKMLSENVKDFSLAIDAEKLQISLNFLIQKANNDIKGTSNLLQLKGFIDTSNLLKFDHLKAELLIDLQSKGFMGTFSSTLKISDLNFDVKFSLDSAKQGMLDNIELLTPPLGYK